MNSNNTNILDNYNIPLKISCSLLNQNQQLRIIINFFTHIGNGQYSLYIDGLEIASISTYGTYNNKSIGFNVTHVQTDWTTVKNVNVLEYGNKTFICASEVELCELK
jgi:hypothetical protein